jgi:hypothetical protein
MACCELQGANHPRSNLPVSTKNRKPKLHSIHQLPQFYTQLSTLVPFREMIPFAPLLDRVPVHGIGVQSEPLPHTLVPPLLHPSEPSWNSDDSLIFAFWGY